MKKVTDYLFSKMISHIYEAKPSQDKKLLAVSVRIPKMGHDDIDQVIDIAKKEKLGFKLEGSLTVYTVIDNPDAA